MVEMLVYALLMQETKRKFFTLKWKLVIGMFVLLLFAKKSPLFIHINFNNEK